MTNRCADITLGIGAQARAILHILADLEPSFATFDEMSRSYNVDIKTFPWYNGKERGVVLTMQRDPDGRCLCVAFGETANSDRVFVQRWVMDEAPLNGPQAEATEGIPRFRAEYPSQNYSEVVICITSEMADFWAQEELPPVTRFLNERKR